MTHSTKDASLKKLGRELDRDRKIYALFGLTALSDARNIISYIFDITNKVGENASDRMHLWLTSPLGMAIAIIDSIFLVTLAVIGNYFEETHSNPIIRKIAFLWPFIRDGIKAVKNAYKGARNILLFVVAFGVATAIAPQILLPLGLFFGFTYLSSRIWYRNMCYHRKKMQTFNEDIKNIVVKYRRKNKSKDNEIRPKNRAYIFDFQKFMDDSESKHHSEKGKTTKNPYEKIKAMAIFYGIQINPPISEDTSIEFFSQFITNKQPGLSKKEYISAAINGFFDGLYLYAGLATLCTLAPALFLAVNAISLIFVVFSVTRYMYEEYSFQRKLITSQLKAQLEINSILLRNAQNQQDQNKIQELEQTTNSLKEQLQQTNKNRYMHGIGEAIRDGLGLYSALTGLLIVVNIVTPIPALLLILTIISGILSVTCFGIYHIHNVYKQNKCENIEDSHDNKFPDKAEIFRSIFSGAKQGSKQSNFVLNNLQEQNEQGHYQSSDLIDYITYGLSIVISIIYGLKAVAKGFGRPKEELNLPNGASPSTSSEEDGAQITSKGESSNNSIDYANSPFSPLLRKENQMCAPEEETQPLTKLFQKSVEDSKISILQAIPA